MLAILTRYRTHTLFALVLVLALSCAILAGCGGSNDSVVHVDGTSIAITKGTLNHWMKASAGGDFRSTIGTQAPAGLVSEPADYPRCEAAVRSVTSSQSHVKPEPKPQATHLCHELYRSLKAQALGILISIRWTIAEAAEKGITISNAEVLREFANFRKRPYPTEPELTRYLHERHWTLSDVLYQLKRNMLVRRILPIFKAKVEKVGTSLTTYAKFVLQRYQRLVQRTTCQPGYVVSNCREYRESQSPPPGPGELMQQLAATHKN